MATFDRFDILAAYHMYAVLWGSDGRTGSIQRRLSALQYRPGHAEEYLNGLTSNAREIYANLVYSNERGAEHGYVECACCGMPTIGTYVMSRFGEVIPCGVDLCFGCEEADCPLDAHDCNCEAEGDEPNDEVSP